MAKERQPDDGKEETSGPVDFIRQIVADDIASNKHGGNVVTRFPPEPNGFLHIGHAKAIVVGFGIAAENGGRCNLRFDDTNPATEESRFVESIQEDIRWLGFDWEDRLYFASDYFERLYECALELIDKGVAYVCSLDEAGIREYRGTVKEAGRPSPDRERPAAESRDLLARMRAGEFEDGAYTLRARIDMAAANMKMRDPLIYRIRRIKHHRTGDAWSIYPMYDFAHGQSDAIEGVTHSFCTLEFQNNRELYDWFLDHLSFESRPRQIEFARFNLSYTALSKRKLKLLVEAEKVTGWDDPRMPTLAGLRRRGYPAAAIRTLCEQIGLAKRDSLVDYAQLEFCVREELNRTATRVMAVLDPIKLVIDNYPDDQSEEVEAVNNPEDESAGTRKMPFSKVLYIERADFREDPPKKYHRLGPGREVRLKHAYFVTCESFEKDGDGNVTVVHCRYDPETAGGGAPDGRRPKGTIHWVSAEHAVAVDVRLYDRLFTSEDPAALEEADFLAAINPDSVEERSGCKVEPAAAELAAGTTVQFLRHGYFCVDAEAPHLFNRTVTLRDSWAKIEKKLAAGG